MEKARKILYRGQTRKLGERAEWATTKNAWPLGIWGHFPQGRRFLHHLWKERGSKPPQIRHTLDGRKAYEDT